MDSKEKARQLYIQARRTLDDASDEIGQWRTALMLLKEACELDDNIKYIQRRDHLAVSLDADNLFGV